MKLWKLWAEGDAFDNLVPVVPLTFDDYNSFDGSPRADIWKPLPVRRMEPEKELPLSDFPGFALPVFSKKAWDCLEPIIGGQVEVLPLVFEEGPYFAINVINVLNAIDYEKSVYQTFTSSLRIMMFTKYVFVKEKVKNHSIFLLSDERRRRPFVSDAFVTMVKSNNLTGFRFELVWDSEEQ